MDMTSLASKLLANSAIRFGVGVLGLLVAVALLAPWLGTVDPAAMDAGHINTASGTVGAFALMDGSSVAHTFWMGSDNFGRDIYSRVLYGTRVSLLVGLFTALAALLVGGTLGMLAGYFRTLDAVLMRFMDGLMAIPAILLAIALVAALGAQLWTVVVAIAVPEIPRVTRLVRSLVLSLREEPFVEAARALATPTPVILWRHILPNAMAPLIVQGTFIAASAVLTEAILSFLGLGLPADIPTWGNIMAEGRVQFSQYPGNVLYPALFLVPTVLAVNLLGDGLRDVLDPKFAKRGAR
jgi:peptide/nickel transport system permease protein